MQFHVRLVAIFAALGALHCSSDGGSPSPTGTGGFYPGTGGAVATGGSVVGTGGSVVGTGSVPAGTGSVPAGTGGIQGGTGGIQGGTGGTMAGSGGGGAVTGGAPGTGGVVGGNVDPVGNENRAPGFVNLAPPVGAPLPETGTTLNPPAPASWQWHPIEGAVCRDGSPTGIFVHKGTAPQLLIFLEGGGACSNVPFCRFNPKNANEILSGDGSSVIGSALGAVAGRQQPGGYSANTPAGIFEFSNSANPFKDWSMVYVPYCTGDVHFGTKADATVPGTVGGDARDIPKHQFMGYRNMEKIIGRVQPTFASSTKVVVTGSSAGSFGAALNFSMIQDAFGNTPVTIIGDSGVPFDDQFMFTCMQKRWRETWGLALPSDCQECKQADGGGMIGLADFLIKKHPKAKLAIISSMQDEVMRLFFSVGLKTCSAYDTADPVSITLVQGDTYMTAEQYTGGLNALLTKYKPTGKMATFFMTGPIHQHIFRPSFYTASAGGSTMAKFVGDFVNAGTIVNVGP